MTNHQSPITPPTELVEQWVAEACPECRLTYDEFTGESVEILATRAAQWGADQELEACCEWLCEAKNHGLGYEYGQELADRYRAARRPKPLSLKEQALELTRPAGTAGAHVTFGPEELALIHRALEQLDG